MYILKNNFEKQGEVLDKNLIVFALESKSLLGFVKRELKQDLEKSTEFLKVYDDSLKASEITAALENIKAFCIENNEYKLYEKYLLLLEDESLILKEMKEIKSKEILNGYDKAINFLLKDNIPLSEMLSFETQEREARAFKESDYENETLCPTVKNIALNRKVPLNLLCDKILEKARIYRENLAILIGKRQALEDSIEKSSSIIELENIKWS